MIGGELASVACPEKGKELTRACTYERINENRKPKTARPRDLRATNQKRNINIAKRAEPTSKYLQRNGARALPSSLGPPPWRSRAPLQPHRTGSRFYGRPNIGWSAGYLNRSISSSTGEVGLKKRPYRGLVRGSWGWAGPTCWLRGAEHGIA
jgi:hypothetical protein